MAKESAAKGKREAKDDLETKPVLKKHKGKSKEKETKSDQANLISAKEVAVIKKTVFVTHLPRKTEISDVINFFKYVGEVVRVRRIVNLQGKNNGFAYVEFASSNEANKALEEKSGQYIREYKIFLDVIKIASYPPKYCIDHQVVCYEDYLRRESLRIEQVETVEERNKTLFVSNLSPQTNILDIHDFFGDIGDVVSVRLIVNNEGKHVGCGFVEFSSTDEAMNVLEETNGEYLHDRKIFLDVVKIAPYPPGPKNNLVEKLWYEDQLPQESVVREKTLFVGHLPRQTKISDIINFFNYVGKVVRVRLIVNRKGEHVSYGFVEFASAKEANKALEELNGEYFCGKKISLGLPDEIASYPPKFCIDHKVWYDDYLGRESLLIEEDETMEGLVEEVAVRKRTRFVANLPPQIEISEIIKFFQNVGKVVTVRLIVNHKGKHVGCGFVEFSSTNEAEKALEKN